MKIAAYNVENMFQRTMVFNQPDESVAKTFSRSATELNLLFEKASYGDDDKRRMVELLDELGFSGRDEARYAQLRKIRGKLLNRSRGGVAMEIVASGREDWIGWVELKKGPIDEVAIQNTARVINDVGADIIALIEVEDRKALQKFNEKILSKMGHTGYEHVMVIEGNDERGIDVGLMTGKQYPLRLMQSHVHEKLPGGNPVFSRDAPEYEVRTPSGERIWVIPCHFKSKFGGDDRRSREKRAAQAAKVAEIYNRLRRERQNKVVVLGDFNDTPDSTPLEALLKGTDLRDVGTHGSFDPGGFNGRGTYGTGTDSQKIDYLLLSPALFRRVRSAGLFRKGAWTASGRWEMYDTLKRPEHSASDHHLIWVELKD
jgi:endonuclease/exonuclease/phosphatase family metal-dependent hydrolase